MNNFRRNLKNLIGAFFILAIIFYIAISFIETDFNPFNWSMLSRIIYAIGALISLNNLKDAL